MINKFKDNIKNRLNFYDKYLEKYCVENAIATGGRIARNNYEINYERSPYTDNYTRAMDAYDKATGLDFI